MAKRRTTAKRRAPARRRSGLVNMDLVVTAATVTGSAMATQYAANYAAQRFAFARSRGGQMATKAGIALAGGYALKKFAGTKTANSFMIGALGVVAADAIAMVRGGGQLSGYSAPMPTYGQGMGELPPRVRPALPVSSSYGEQSGGRSRVTAFGSMN